MSPALLPHVSTSCLFASIFGSGKSFVCSCQPLLGVNLSPEFVTVYFPYAGWGLSFFLLVAAAFWIPTSMCGSGRNKQCCAKIRMHNLKSHFQQDFLAYCTRPVSVHLAMASVGCSFNSFSIFMFSSKRQQNLMKTVFSCIHFSTWPYPPKTMRKKTVFYTGKLYGVDRYACFTNNALRVVSKTLKLIGQRMTTALSFKFPLQYVRDPSTPFHARFSCLLFVVCAGFDVWIPIFFLNNLQSSTGYGWHQFAPVFSIFSSIAAPVGTGSIRTAIIRQRSGGINVEKWSITSLHWPDVFTLAR